MALPAFSASVLSAYEANMLTWADHLVTYIGGLSASSDEALNSTYYDLQRCALQIKTYRDDAGENTSTWDPLIALAELVYRTTYLHASTGNGSYAYIPGYWVFSQGMRMDFQANADANAQADVRVLANNSAFGIRNSYVLDNSPSAAFSRENAYILMAKLDEKLCYPSDPISSVAAEAKEYAFGHFNQWFVTKTASQIYPFQVALASEALIRYHAEIDTSAAFKTRLIAALRLAWNTIWSTMWDPQSRSFLYVNSGPDVGAAPDLNLMCVMPFGWLYHNTGEEIWITKGDQIFAGGVANTYFGTPETPKGKAYGQNYRVSMDYLAYREDDPIVDAIPDEPEEPEIPDDPIPDPGDPNAPQPVPNPYSSVGGWYVGPDGSFHIGAALNKDLTLSVSGLGQFKFNVNGRTVGSQGATGIDGDNTLRDGDLVIGKAGKGVEIKGGLNARIGTATLASGTIAVANKSVTANTLVIPFRITEGSAAGFIKKVDKVVGTSFTLTSSNAGDNGQIGYVLIEMI